MGMARGIEGSHSEREECAKITEAGTAMADYPISKHLEEHTRPCRRGVNGRGLGRYSLWAAMDCEAYQRAYQKKAHRVKGEWGVACRQWERGHAQLGLWQCQGTLGKVRCHWPYGDAPPCQCHIQQAGMVQFKRKVSHARGRGPLSPEALSVGWGTSSC